VGISFHNLSELSVLPHIGYYRFEEHISIVYDHSLSCSPICMRRLSVAAVPRRRSMPTFHTIRTLIRRTKQIFRLKHVRRDDDLGLNRSLAGLPMELQLMVVEFLPPESVLSLSLSCKMLSVHYRPCTIRDALVKQRFLLLLEREFPDMLICYTCNKLYNWRAALQSSSKYARRPHACPKLHAARDHAFLYRCTKAFYIEDRDLILRRHKLGDSYGIPLSYLDGPMQRIDVSESILPQNATPPEEHHTAHSGWFASCQG
jgi:hypothetical protein